MDIVNEVQQLESCNKFLCLGYVSKLILHIYIYMYLIYFLKSNSSFEVFVAFRM